MKNRILCLAVVMGFAALFSSVEKAHAIPAFARLYKTECSTCHTIFPDRNQFGDAFRKNSYTWPGNVPAPAPEGTMYAPPRQGKSARTGQSRPAPQPFQGMSSAGQIPPSGTSAATSEEESGQAMLPAGGGELFVPMPGREEARQWLTVIPEYIPISLWVNHDFVFNRDKTPQIDLDGLTELELFSAGNFRGKAGWWVEYNFAPDHDIGEVYLQFRHLFGSPINVKGGKFKPKLSLWKSNDSATISSYGYNEMVVGINPTVTQAQLDAVGATMGNPFMIDREQGGVEVNSLVGNRVFLAGGVVTPPEKNNNGVQYYGHASVRVGGTDFNGNLPINLEKESLWDYLALTFGTFGYFGSSINTIQDPVTERALRFSNDFYRLGFESEVLYKNFRTRMNCILGRDKNPQGPAGTGLSEKSTWFMVQGQYIFMRNILAAMRFEYQDIEHEGITRRYIPTIEYAPWQNVKLGLEYVHEIQPKVVQPHFINREYTLRLTFAY